MLFMILYKRFRDIRNPPSNSMNFGFETYSLADKVIQQQLDLLNDIGMSSLTSPFNQSKIGEPESKVKEDINRKIRALSKNSDDFYNID
jgi:hypothetical protein